MILMASNEYRYLVNFVPADSIVKQRILKHLKLNTGIYLVKIDYYDCNNVKQYITKNLLKN